MAKQFSPSGGRNYNNNKLYPMGGVTPKDTGRKDSNHASIRPAMKKGPAPADMGTTSARGQAARFFKGSQKGGM